MQQFLLVLISAPAMAELGPAQPQLVALISLFQDCLLAGQNDLFISECQDLSLCLILIFVSPYIVVENSCMLLLTLSFPAVQESNSCYRLQHRYCINIMVEMTKIELIIFLVLKQASSEILIRALTFPVSFQSSDAVLSLTC